MTNRLLVVFVVKHSLSQLIEINMPNVVRAQLITMVLLSEGVVQSSSIELYLLSETHFVQFYVEMIYGREKIQFQQSVV